MSRKVIEIKNLSYTYPDGCLALKEVNLDIFEGESIGIIGPNGAGKTTLLLHLNGILRANGEIRILGLELNNKNLANIRSKVGLVFQDPDNQLFMPTVFDDVSFGPINMMLTGDELTSRVEEALREVDMLDSARCASHHLSFGEKKRISIATVLSMKPQILALDEPSSNLDPKSRRSLIDLLRRLEVTKIIATHDLELILELCSKVAIMDKGQVITQGDTREILKNESLMNSHGLEVPLSLKKALNY